MNSRPKILLNALSSCYCRFLSGPHCHVLSSTMFLTKLSPLYWASVHVSSIWQALKPRRGIPNMTCEPEVHLHKVTDETPLQQYLSVCRGGRKSCRKIVAPDFVVSMVHNGSVPMCDRLMACQRKPPQAVTFIRRCGLISNVWSSGRPMQTGGNHWADWSSSV